MKIVNAILCAMMILFIGVQFNDPDGLLWALIYAVPAIWAGFAAFRLGALLGNGVLALLLACLLAALVMTVSYWPSTPDFWKQDVWWETETAREGMGIMIATIVLLVVAVTVGKARAALSLKQ